MLTKMDSMADIIDAEPRASATHTGVKNLGEKLSHLLANRRGHLLGLLAFYLLLFVEYYRFVYGCFSMRMGFAFSFDPVKVLVGFCMVAVLLMLLSSRSLSDRLYAVSVVVTLLACLPQIVMYQLGGCSPFGAIYSLLLLLLLTIPSMRLPQLPSPRISEKCSVILVTLLTVLALVPFLWAYGLPTDLSVFALDEHIYEVRQEASQQGSLLTAYLQGPLGKVLLPLMMLLSIGNVKKRWPLLLIGLVGMLYLFMVNPEKSIFFSVFVVLACYLFRDCYAKAGLLIYCLLAVCVLSVLVRLLTGSLMAESIVVRRLFFIPSLVTEAYFEFFAETPVCLSHSFLGSFFEYPYAVEPSHLVGQMMYGRSTINCNTGIIADGFMNFGHIGAAIFVSMTAFVLHLVEACDYDSRYFGLVFLLVFTFLNSAFFTTLLTHGGLFLLLMMLFIVPRRDLKNWRQ